MGLTFQLQVVFLCVISVAYQCGSLPIIKGFFMTQPLAAGEDCIDEFGQVRNHLDYWNATVGSCDKAICFHGFLKNYVIKNRCRVIEDVEMPDLVNCQRVSDLTQHYPDCCPVLECATGVYPTTPSGPVCKDVHAEIDCQKWDSLGACNPSHGLFTNMSLNVYCAKTCGVCS